MIHARVRLRFKGSTLSAAVKIFRLLLERTRAIPGCLGCSLYQDLEEPDSLIFEEWWQTRENLEKRLRSEPYRQVLLVMEAAAEPPEVSFFTVTGLGGMDLIEDARRP
jgi:quinol monooxygenase YgiN